MIKIGLTGSIGSGKTTVSKIFKERGIPVFNSDTCAREAESETHIQEEYKRILGEDVYVEGQLDRAKIRAILFTDKDKLQQVNKLVTPYIKQKFEKFCVDNADHQIVMLESAILFETNTTPIFDYIVTVTASENTRMTRVIKRDNATLEEVLNKLKVQLPELEKIGKSNFIIINDGYDLIDSITLLSMQVDTIHKAIKYDMVAKAASDLADTLHDTTKELDN
jgi:dephospho-CoA kinase